MVKRIKTWLVIVSLLAALLGPVVVAVTNNIFDNRLQTPSQVPLPPEEPYVPQEPTCMPAVDQSIFDSLEALIPEQVGDSAVSLRMAELFAADQAVRMLPGDDVNQIAADDTARRVEVLGYLQNGEIRTARDLVYAAFIFQHGECPEHYLLANRLAEVAMDADYGDARWLYAATLDRYLMSLGQPQKFGTQYTFVNGVYKLYRVDPAITDEERALYGVPSLEEAIQNTPSVSSGQGTTRQGWLASWWLTLIGAGFALLAAGIGIVDPIPNALPGRIALVIAFVVYVVSTVGHYFQVNALMEGTYEVQQQAWGIVNFMMVSVWYAFAIFEAIRVIKARANQHPNPNDNL